MKAFAEHLALRNMELTYQLQRGMFLLTILGVVVGLLSTAGRSREIGELWQNLLAFVRGIR